MTEEQLEWSCSVSSSDTSGPSDLLDRQPSLRVPSIRSFLETSLGVNQLSQILFYNIN